MITIRKAEESDFDAIWRIFHEVVRRGDTYTFDPETTKEQAHSIWMSSGHATYVACADGRVVGTYILKPNQPGLGSHVANAGYMVGVDGRGRGTGSAMCEHSLEEARRMGFRAMQFNIVVSTNESAVALWKRFGFSIVGTLPQAYCHRELGLVDDYVMHRFL
ncbi:MAG TPA: GNAT family N-acetyltransferase [Pyrinomonadaceae bacterium]|jgi:L-amino acid N-acyltransferase YncA|nr:GNAT family N-acetyltransferase [Pyrinomonadaceae bacterium]